MEERQYYWTDLESGVSYPCSKEYYDAMRNIWEQCIPKLVDPPKGHLMITGTPSGENDFYKNFIMGCDPYEGEGGNSKAGFIPRKFFKKER